MACVVGPLNMLWCARGLLCYALTGCSSLQEVSLSGIGSGLSALATCDADVW